jgi:cell division protein FtsB
MKTKINLDACKKFWTEDRFRMLYDVHFVAAHDLGGLIHDVEQLQAELKQRNAELDFCTKRMTAKDTEIERLNTIIHNRAEDMELKAEIDRLKEKLEVAESTIYHLKNAADF